MEFGSVFPYFRIYVKNWIPTEDKRFLDGGRGAPTKFLEAYMGKVVWPHPPEAERQGLHGYWPNVKA
jgi:hypothetical protein